MSNRPGPSTAPSNSRPSLRNQILFALGILVLAAGAFYTALVVATQIDRIFLGGTDITLGSTLSNLPGIDKGASASDIGGGRLNILVMGIDKRPHEGAGSARTDTMFVMTVDPATRTARGLAMPRDLWVEIPSSSGNTFFQERINTAFNTGETRNPGGGPALAKAVVERLLGIKINYYVIIDFEGFKQVIDVLDGIDVDVASPGVNDPFYSETERLGDFYPCIFEPGLHHMNGSQALCYARVRNNSNDLDRISRQQRVMLAVMDKAAQLNLLSDVTSAQSLYKRYKGAITTDINDLQIPGFARLATAIDANQMAFLSLGAAVTSYRTPMGADVLLPSKDGVKQLVEAFVSDNRLLQENARIEVQNGTGIDGHAKKAGDFLVTLGIGEANLFPTNAATANHARSEIIDFTGKTYTAQKVATWLSLPKNSIRRATDADAAVRHGDADIVIIVGADAKLEIALANPGSQ